MCVHIPQKWCRARPSVCVAKHWLIGRHGKWQNPTVHNFNMNINGDLITLCKRIQWWWSLIRCAILTAPLITVAIGMKFGWEHIIGGKEGGYGRSNRIKSCPFKTQWLHVPPSLTLKYYFTHMQHIYSPLFPYDFDNEQQLFSLIWWFFLTESYCLVRSRNGIFKYYSDKFHATKC